MFEELIPVSAANFFAVSLEAFSYSGKPGDPLSKKHLLPSLSFFYETPDFAQVALGWSEKGIFVSVFSEEPTRELHFPDFRKGDSLELFIDTRDVKTVAHVTRFCHHFCILPEILDENAESIQALEVTRFRGDDSHPLADPQHLIVESEKKRRGYQLHVFISQEALFGYDPTQFDRLGFTYRINRTRNEPQYFSAAGSDVVIENQPSLWASVKLVKK